MSEEAKQEETKVEQETKNETKEESLTEEPKVEQETKNATMEESLTEESKVVEETKTAPMEESLTEDDLKTVEDVKDRLKFFFSDANVRQDFFIRKLLTRDGGDNPKMVPIESLLKFNTIKRHTTKPALIIKAAKGLSELLTLDEKGTAIGRVVPFTGDMMNDNIPKSLYVKNLPLKATGGDDSPRQYDVTMDQVRELFDKYGEVTLVKLKWSSTIDGKGDEDLIGHQKRQKKKFPVGCAMIEFLKKEDLEKAAEATLTFKDGEKVEPKEKVVIGEEKVELEVMLLSQYIDIRKKEKEVDEKENGGSNKREREEDDEEEDKDIPIFTFDWKPNCVIKMEGLPESCDREEILNTIATGMEISVNEVKARKVYADYSRGQTGGAIRFPECGDHIAKMATSLKNGELKIQDAKVEDARVLEGDEEKKYWDDFIAFKNKQINHREEEKRSRKKQKRGGRGGGRGGGRFGGRGGGRGRGRH
jgi:lupus La protein